MHDDTKLHLVVSRAASDVLYNAFLLASATAADHSAASCAPIEWQDTNTYFGNDVTARGSGIVTTTGSQRFVDDAIDRLAAKLIRFPS